MSHFTEHTFASTLEEIATLNTEEVMLGYWSGIDNEPPPGSDKCRSFAQGWRNGRVDGGHTEPCDAQIALLDEVAALRGQVMQ